MQMRGEGMSGKVGYDATQSKYDLEWHGLVLVSLSDASFGQA